MKMFKHSLFTLTALYTCAVSSSLHAAVVSPGESVFLSGTTLSLNPELAGTDRYDFSDYYDFRPDPIPAGWGHYYKSQAIQSDLSKSLVFSLQLVGGFNITQYSAVYIDTISLSGYTGWTTDIFYRTDAMGDRGPTSVQRSANGDQLLFSFAFPLTLNNLVGGVLEESYPIQILTDAQAFDTTGRAIINGRSLNGLTGEWGEFEVYLTDLAVPTAVPLPASLPLLLSAIGLLFGLKRLPGRAS